MHHNKSTYLCLVSSALLACSAQNSVAVPPPSESKSDASPSPSAALISNTAPSMTPYIDAVATETERRELEDLIRRANGVLRSAEFRANLLALDAVYPEVYANRDIPRATVRAIMDLLSLTAPGTRQVRVPVALVGGEAYGGGSFNYAAYTGPTGAFLEQPSPGSMSIGRVTMYRNRQWREDAPVKGDPVDHSCAINTMAHEISHTVSTSQTIYTFAFTDEVGRKDKTAPLASYLIGSVAQCTYLQVRGRISSAGVPACVKIFGTHNFNNLRCPAFSGNRPVELRSDLPSAADPL